MSRRAYFITHPNVVISKDVPVPEWPLSIVGRQRMRAGISQHWTREITSIYCSTERKAIDGAEILAEALNIKETRVEALGENDRSATGFLPPEEFELVANEFFAEPKESARGWERAVDAQERIVKAIKEISESDRTSGAIAIVSHGAVGTLLYCKLASVEISRRWDQPPNGGGNYFSFSLEPFNALSWWQAYDKIAA